MLFGKWYCENVQSLVMVIHLPVGNSQSRLLYWDMFAYGTDICVYTFNNEIGMTQSRG